MLIVLGLMEETRKDLLLVLMDLFGTQIAIMEITLAKTVLQIL